MAMVRGTWQGNTCTITDPVKGTLTVLQTEVRGEAQLGSSMSRLRPMIESRLRAELGAALRVTIPRIVSRPHKRRAAVDCA
jgi:hypothetical protein